MASLAFWAGWVGAETAANPQVDRQANPQDARGRPPSGEALKTLDAFVKHVSRSSFDSEAKRFVIDQWPKRRGAEDVGAFLCEALAVLDATFKQGLDAYAAKDFGRARDLMKKLTSAKDRYLSTNARVFEIKALVGDNQIGRAAKALSELRPDFADMKRYTVHVPELHLLLVFCQQAQGQGEESLKTLKEFLASHPEAPGELRAAAVDLLGRLSLDEGGGIGEAADLMADAGRRLADADAGLATQAKQEKAVALLDKLIAEAEKCERSAGQCKSCSGKGCKKCSGSKPKANKPSSPAKKSAVSGGATKIGPQRTVVARPGQQWGRMRPEERARILQSLEGQFPSRYRQLIKQYFQTLAKQP